MKHIDRRVSGAGLPRARCRYCRHEIVQVADIGWIDPARGETYDLCPNSAYSDHEPDDARESAARFGPVV